MGKARDSVHLIDFQDRHIELVADFKPSSVQEFTNKEPI
jgi:hypothetical protein